jgi:hypothetical protein
MRPLGPRPAERDRLHSWQFPEAISDVKQEVVVVHKRKLTGVLSPGTRISHT